MSNDLTRDDKTDLRRLEKLLQSNLQAFLIAGKTLMEIRDRKLYRENYKTFEAYCADRWNLKRSYAYYLINAAEVDENLSTMVDKNERPSTERQYRELAKADPEEQAEIWQEVQNEVDVPTAKDIKEAIERRKEPEPFQGELLDSNEPEIKPASPRIIDATEHLFEHDTWYEAIKGLWAEADGEGIDEMRSFILDEERAWFTGVLNVEYKETGYCNACRRRARSDKPGRNELDVKFDEFWLVCHIKVGKEAARKAFFKAVDRICEQFQWDKLRSCEYLIDKMREYAASPKGSKCRFGSKLHPATWLNQGRYDDDPKLWEEAEYDSRDDIDDDQGMTFTGEVTPL